jgi:hypothetical protein
MRLLTVTHALASLSLAVALAVGQTDYHFVSQRQRQALDVRVRSGDRLRIEAGGCLMGPEGDQALIFVPGATMVFSPVTDLIGRELVVPPSLAYPTEPRIWLDWGRFERGPLEISEHPAHGQIPCPDPREPLRLDIRITPGSEPDRSGAGTLTLAFERYDANLLPVNPNWAGGVRPNPCAACDGFRLERRADGSSFVRAVRSERCTLQKPPIDAGCSPHQARCGAAGRALSGHVNWGPATFTGRLSAARSGPIHIARDGDAEFFLSPDGGAGLIAPEGDPNGPGAIRLEFASAPTLQWFRTPWWRELPYRKRSYEPMASLFHGLSWHPGAKPPGPSVSHRPATAIGLFGIDTAHHPHPELHPVYALAVQTEADSEHEVWEVFARRWGTEGDCGSRLDHQIGLGRVALELVAAGRGPWRRARGRFFDHGLPAQGWRVYAGARAPTLVLDLPAEQRCSVVEGELVLLVSQAGEGFPLLDGEAPVSDPVRWSAVHSPEQLCVSEPWFVPVR